jgi:hypothetical protein
MKKAADAIRRERDIRSVKATQSLLRSIAAKPAEFLSDAKLAEVLRSQGALAKHADESLGIVAMSLNTQKLVAEEALGSYDLVDRLRRGALEALENSQMKAASSNKSTKAGLLLRVNELEEEVSALQGDLGQMTHAFARLVSIGRSLTDELGTPSALARWQKELRSIQGGLSLCKKPIKTNVVFMKQDHAKG